MLTLLDDSSIITVDGAAGSGKGTLAQRLARHLGWHLLDSGAIYRVVALAALDEGLDLDDGLLVSRLIPDLSLQFLPQQDGSLQILLAGNDVSRAIRTEDCGCAASRIAAHAGVRAELLELQRSFAKPPGLVADGRDMGTVIFPQAGLKIFLLASPQERAKRRYKQLKANGQDASIDRLIHDITERDERDCNRKEAPLKPADDAVMVDTDTLAADEVFAKVLNLASKRFDIQD